jgi:hypothetical protein
LQRVRDCSGGRTLNQAQQGFVWFLFLVFVAHVSVFLLGAGTYVAPGVSPLVLLSL